MLVECSRFLLSTWPNRTKRICLLLASWTPLVPWLLLLDWVEAVEIRACADNRASKSKPSWLEPFAFSPPRCSHFFSFSNFFTSGNKVDYRLMASQVVQGTRFHTGEDVWAVKELSKMFLFVFPLADCPGSRPFLTLHCCRWTRFPSPLPYFRQTAPSPTPRISCVNGRWRYSLRGQPSSTFLECLEASIAWASYAW